MKTSLVRDQNQSLDHDYLRSGPSAPYMRNTAPITSTPMFNSINIIITVHLLSSQAAPCKIESRLAHEHRQHHHCEHYRARDRQHGHLITHHIHTRPFCISIVIYSRGGRVVYLHSHDGVRLPRWGVLHRGSSGVSSREVLSIF